VLEAELEIELSKDLIFAPARIIDAYAADEVDVLAWNCGSADLPGSRLPAPVELEALAVPSNHGLAVANQQSW
jgi:hypothetical protein